MLYGNVRRAHGPMAAVLLVLLSWMMAMPVAAQSELNSVGVMELSNMPDAFAEAVKNANISRIGSFYDENAIVFSPDGAVAQGRDNIARLYARNAQAGENRMVFRQVSMEKNDNRASIVWLWDLAITPRGRPPVTLTGRSLLYLAKTPFGWKIIFDMFQIVPQAPEE